MEFVLGLSTISRGSPTEKLQWTFNLYDINGDGCITREEMREIINSIYNLLGRFTEPCVSAEATRDHADRVFDKLDLNKDGIVTFDEFLETCLHSKASLIFFSLLIDDLRRHYGTEKRTEKQYQHFYPLVKRLEQATLLGLLKKHCKVNGSPLTKKCRTLWKTESTSNAEVSTLNPSTPFLCGIRISTHIKIDQRFTSDKEVQNTVEN
ncbi:Calsenilin [Araneus ventricosus]|uniref:Calsenilin n=1 Tax=Araneus ventricosus TaxID=182803 RepID=A0A4Y2HQI9_ARAVE|nr:Calsenilin [Araneus ventricosus]